MATAVSRAPKNADLWSSHDKMLAQPLKDSDIEVRLGVFVGVLRSQCPVYFLVLTPSALHPE